MRYSAAVSDQPDRATEETVARVTRTAYAPGSISPRAASYTPGATCTSPTSAGSRSGPRRPRSCRRNPVAIRRSRPTRRGAWSCPRSNRTRLRCPGLLARERPRHQLAEEAREAIPANPVPSPASGRIRGPGDRPTEAVLPLRQERVVTGGDQDRLRRCLGRRAVVAAQPGHPLVEAAQDRRRGGQDREERLLDDLLARDLLRLLEEDVRDAGGFAAS